MKKERMELRLTKAEKEKIINNAKENNMSASRFLLSCADAVMSGKYELKVPNRNCKISQCLMDINDIASETHDERSIRLLKRLGDLECLL